MSGRSSRIIGVAVAILLAAAGFTCAAPAQADVINLDMNCDPSGSQVVTITTKDTLSVVSTNLTTPCDGNYVIVLFPTPVGNAWLNGTLIPQDGSYRTFPGGSWTMTFASEVPGFTHFTMCNSGSFVCPTLRVDVVQADEEIPAIPPWQQSVGRASATATCASGWQPSWQQWAEHITGGWVCTRTIPSLGN